MNANALDLSRVAQTNIALYRQMHEVGFGASALGLARDAYELVSVPFAGHYRACGKPFVCHLVGTASIMVSLGASAELVAAGILHAAYEPYFFTGNNHGASRLTPRGIRARVGEEVERQVAAYNGLKWSLVTIPALADEARSVQGDRAGILLLKLANELDDHIDHSMAYCSEAKQAIDSAFDLWLGMATSLGFPTLAAALSEVRQEQRHSEWARPLGSGRVRVPFGAVGQGRFSEQVARRNAQVGRRLTPSEPGATADAIFAEETRAGDRWSRLHRVAPLPPAGS